MVMELGTFELTGNELIATDPCYDKGTWCSHVIPDAKPGRWSAAAVLSDEGVWGTRVAELHVWNEDSDRPDPKELVEADIGVDSGQCGFFDYTKFPDDPGDYGNSSWYDRACDLTHDRTNKERRYAGIMEGMGVNSSSGFGDGSYDLYVGRNNEGQVVSAKVVFITDEDEEDYD